MITHTALRNPLGVALFGASLVLAVIATTLPALTVWSDRGWWLVVTGAIAYAASVAAVHWASAQAESGVGETQLRAVLDVRSRLQAWAHRATASGSESPAVLASVVQTIQQLEERVIPALRLVLARHAALAAILDSYNRGRLPSPDRDVLARLRAIEARQRDAIADCVQQAISAEATLLAISHENRDASELRDEARSLGARWTVMHSVLLDLLRDA